MTNVEEQNVDYEFDESVEDYSDDYDYEADEVEQDVTAHKNKKIKSNDNKMENLLDSSLDVSGHGHNNSFEEPHKDDRNDLGVYATILESKYSAVKSKYNEAKQEINELKRKRKTEPMANPDERVKQLEDRVILIKTKAKERIAEKDAVIEEQNEKLNKFEEILSLLEVNCKQAVVKYNEAQIELAKKEETLQLHLSFKNRYDYKVNYLDEKCRKIQNEYEVKIRKLEEKLGIENKGSETESKPEIKVEQKLKITKVTDTKVTKGVVSRKPRTLKMEANLPKVAKGVSIKEVETTVEEELESIEESKVLNEEPKPIVTSLPGVKITLTEEIDELGQLEFEDPKLE